MSLGILCVFLGIISNDQEAAKVADILQNLEAKYQASQFVKENYKASKDERREALRVFEISDPIAARSEYEAMIQKFPQSPDVWADYVLFLDRARKPEEAVKKAEESVALFPNQVRLKIIHDFMVKLKKTANKSQKSEIRQDMDAQLAAWNQLTLNHRAGKRVAAKSSTASTGSLEK